ncbi:leukocyte elastase inhibitor-like [Hemicordylus capensis]|uniref:leukocyte elastase inhibitor-like n=1 Tax=Hemicordylus capensis TaxID=884348 RepID=UPI0023044902|nr:leukocyte elastase inhibitor-like [Hemicordylus capensis]
MSSVCTAISEFGWDLFKEISKDGAQKNIFLSPFSISAALAMVAYGARGDTEAQMEKVHFLYCSEVFNHRANSHVQHLRKVRTSQYYMRSNICVHNLQKYLRCTKELYHAGLESVDFEKAQTRENINSWVASQTQGKIKDLFPEDSLDPPIAMVIVNAIYFKGLWSSRFKKEDTKAAPFRVDKNVSKNVPMMFQSGRFKYAAIQEPPLQLLELPYAGEVLSMMIILPKDSDEGDNSSSQEKLASFLTYKNIEEWSSKMYFQEVNVYLPRFKLEEKYELKETLESMGMTLLFDQSEADLSGISEEKDLSVSEVIHKSFVEVNEEGTEAAAATGVTNVSAPTSVQIPVEFKADETFIFIILHNVSKCPLFIGRIASP